MIGHTGELASAYLDGETTAAESERLRAHLDGCEACRNEVADIHMARSALRALPTLEMPAELIADLGFMADVISLRRRPPVWIAAAAAALILFVTFAALATTPKAVGVPLMDVSKVYQQQSDLGSTLVPDVGSIRSEAAE